MSLKMTYADRSLKSFDCHQFIAPCFKFGLASIPDHYLLTKWRRVVIEPIDTFLESETYPRSRRIHP
ncbi:hypothetical protein ABKN59_010527 [Abortiporus biennis]